jgi:hypothetical protein
VILGTDILRSPTQDNASESVWFYTKPVKASVQLGDTYYSFLIVRSSVAGYAYVELGIDTTPTIISDIKVNSTQWNISMTSTPNPDHGLYIAQMNITFDDKTLKGISKNLTAANRTSISIRYIFRFYDGSTIIDLSSPKAFISIKESDKDDSDEGDSGGNDNSGCNDNREGGNPTTGSTQEHSSGHMTTNGIDNHKELFSAVSSSFPLCIVIKLLIFCSFILPSFFSVV